MNTSKRPQARENVTDKVALGFGFVSDWLSRWREFSGPITERSEAKPMQSRITFDTQLKIALLLSFTRGITYDSHCGFNAENFSEKSPNPNFHSHKPIPYSSFHDIFIINNFKIYLLNI